MYGGLSPHGCTWRYYQRFLYLLLLLLSTVVDIMILSDIYIAFYFELADDIYSVLVFCTDPYLYVFSLLFVECSKRTVVFNSTATLASLHHVRFQGELLFLAWTGSSSSRLDALKFWHGLAV